MREIVRREEKARHQDLSGRNIRRGSGVRHHRIYRTNYIYINSINSINSINIINSINSINNINIIIVLILLILL